MTNTAAGYSRNPCGIFMSGDILKGLVLTMKKTISFILGAIMAFFTASMLFVRIKAVCACKRAEGSFGHAVAILITVIIGALLLAGLYLLFGDVVMPKITEKINEMFNYSTP
jgi:hypothetical protein